MTGSQVRLRAWWFRALGLLVVEVDRQVVGEPGNEDRCDKKRRLFFPTGALHGSSKGRHARLACVELQGASPFWQLRSQLHDSR